MFDLILLESERIIQFPNNNIFAYEFLLSRHIYIMTYLFVGLRAGLILILHLLTRSPQKDLNDEGFLPV